MARRFQRRKLGDKIPIEDYNELLDIVEALSNLKVTGGKFQITKGSASLDITPTPPSIVRYAQLTENLSAAGAGAPDTDATTANAHLLIYDQSGASSAPYDIMAAGSDFDITIVNRSQDLSATSGDFCVVARVWFGSGFEWAIIAKDC